MSTHAGDQRLAGLRPSPTERQALRVAPDRSIRRHLIWSLLSQFLRISMASCNALRTSGLRFTSHNRTVCAYPRRKESGERHPKIATPCHLRTSGSFLATFAAVGRHPGGQPQLGCRRQSASPAATGRNTGNASPAACSSKPATWTANGVEARRTPPRVRSRSGWRRTVVVNQGLGAWPTCGKLAVPPPFGLTPDLEHHHFDYRHRRPTIAVRVRELRPRTARAAIDGKICRASPAPSAAAGSLTTAQAGRA